MYLDERANFGQHVALNTGAPGTYQIGDVIDLKSVTTAPNATPDPGDALYCVLRVDVAASSGGSATGQFHLVSDAQGLIAADGTASYHFSTGPIPYAQMTAGRILACFKLPSGRCERYLGLLQTTGTAAFTGGKIGAVLTSDPALYRGYGDNVR